MMLRMLSNKTIPSKTPRSSTTGNMLRVQREITFTMSPNDISGATVWKSFSITLSASNRVKTALSLWCVSNSPFCAILLKPHKKDDEHEASLKERMGTAYKAAGQTFVQRYVEAIGRLLHPSVTLILVTVAILGMIFGAFSFESHPIIASIFTIFAVLGLIGLSTKKFMNSFNNSYERILQRYKKAVLGFIQRPFLSMGITGGAIALLIWLMNITPTAMVPNEDTGTIMGVVTMSPGTSQDRTEAFMLRVDSSSRPLICAQPVRPGRTSLALYRSRSRIRSS